MGLFSKDDNKVKKNPMDSYRKEINEYILNGEIIEGIYPLFVDFLCITNRRLIFVNKDLSFKEPKTTMVTLPYKNINSVELEKKVTGFTDKIIISARSRTYELKFIKNPNLKEIYNLISEKII